MEGSNQGWEQPQSSLGRKNVGQAGAGMRAAARKGKEQLEGTLGFNLSPSHTLGVETLSCSPGREFP